MNGHARSIRIVGLPLQSDISDWLDAGHSKEELLAFIAATPKWTADGTITAQPHQFPAEETLARYDWLLGKHLLRGEVSGTAAMSGTGKSNMSITEALAMASGRQLLHDTVPARPLRVVLINLEDTRNTMEKRIAAVMRHYGLTAADIGDRLIVKAKGEIKIKIAKLLRSGDVERSTQTIKALTNLMLAQRADVLSIDSFIRTHGVNENNNTEIKEVVECFEEVASAANGAVHLWHHTRKMGGEKASVEAARGAQAFIDACRSVRIMDVMTRKERDELKTIVPDIGEPGYYFRAFNGKRNFAPPSDQSDWFRYVSVRLRNWSSEFEDDGDSMGVVTPWQYPAATIPITTTTEVDRACAVIRAGGPWRHDPRSTQEPWVGVAVARALGLDLLDQRVKRAVAGLVRDWLAAGRLRRVMRPDARRQQRAYVEAV
jgi:hypothetical protein